jgi:predicted Zn-dependent protease
MNMAYAYERLGQLEKARLAFEQVIAKSQRAEPLAHLGMASIALQKGDVDTASHALQAARAAWGSAPPSAAWYHYAGIEAVMRGDPERAAAILAEGVSRYPVSAALLNNLSAAHEACGNVRAIGGECKRNRSLTSRASSLSAKRSSVTAGFNVRATRIHVCAVESPCECAQRARSRSQITQECSTLIR